MSYRNCRILNKNTNEIYYGQIDTELEGQSFYQLVEIPDDGKTYIANDESPYYVEDIDAEQKQTILEAKNVRDKIYDNITNSVILDQLQLKAGEITQDIYDTRLAAKTALYTTAKTQFYTTTGLTEKTITV